MGLPLSAMDSRFRRDNVLLSLCSRQLLGSFRMQLCPHVQSPGKLLLFGMCELYGRSCFVFIVIMCFCLFKKHCFLAGPFSIVMAQTSGVSAASSWRHLWGGCPLVT